MSELQACNFIKKETLTEVFSCEFYEISKNTFFKERSGRRRARVQMANNLIFPVLVLLRFYL